MSVWFVVILLADYDYCRFDVLMQKKWKTAFLAAAIQSVYLSCSWSQCDSNRNQPLFGVIRHGAKGGAEEHRRFSLDVLQFDL